MVTNSSGLGQDLAEAGQAISDGAHAVGEALGLVEADVDVVPGDPALMASVAEHLTTLGAAFERAGQGFKAIDAGGWRGEAAEGFEDFLAGAPPRWFRAADSFGDAGAAVQRYSEVLAEAKREAAEAKTRLEQAKQASQAAAARHNAAVEHYNAQAQAANQGGPPPGPRPGSFVDPAAEDRAAAEHTIDRAKQAVQQAGADAARTVVTALEAAPAEPGMMTQLKANFMDGMSEGGRLLGSVAAGAGEAVAGLAQLARMVAPLDPYRLTHPAQANEAAVTLAAGLAGAVKDPYAAIKTTVDIDGWRNQPGRTLGSMIPDAVASLAGGAGVASRLGSGARRVAKGAEKLADGPHPHPEARGLEPHHPEQPGPQQLADPHHAPDRHEGGPHHAPEHAGSRPPGTPTPEQQVQDALDHVRVHGDGIEKFGDRYDGHFEPGAEHLPEGLSRNNPDPWGNDATVRPREDDPPEFIYRNVDPSDDANALWRAVGERDLHNYFEEGIHPRNPDGTVNIHTMDAHTGGVTAGGRFVSTSDSLEHVLQRGQNRPDAYGVILKIRSGGGIDTDATLHEFLAGSRYGYESHGEREILLKDGAHPSIIEGAHRATAFDTAGKPTAYDWIPNPNFNPDLLRKGAR